ncbi:MAG TPA: N-acetylmuramoyl-L-alanine amidase, partial [Bacillales bacterium]|nr:N-acetylmuramoyl-L-alanine amidase [Bacillales bacterium]
DRFTVIDQTDNWYHIKLPSGTEAYVAGWIVVPSKKEKAALSGKTIVVDPGHGGKDSGAIGINGIMEKNLTLQTASELATKLRNAGAHVIMTKNNDTFISLQGRVDIAEEHNADAFISIHYNASLLQNEGGITSYYYTKSKDRPLALAIQQMLVKQTDLRNRGVRFADYHVLRENSQPAALLELGFVTNPGEVHVIRTSAYQDTITTAIVNGIENYFQGNK